MPTPEREDLPLPVITSSAYAVSLTRKDMKRIIVYLTISHMAFTCGVAASSLWNRFKGEPKQEQIQFVLNRPSSNTLPVVSTPTAPHREIVFGKDRLRIVTNQVRMESKRLHYKVDVSYPEILGTKELHIQKLNRDIRERVAAERPLNPSKADLQYYKDQHPEDFNTNHLDYEIRLATDSVLSIYFIGYSYAIGARHSVQYSFTVNYDLALRKELKLSDIFKPKSKYFEFIARYCTEELSKRPRTSYIFSRAFSPKAKDFENWNITPYSITFNFDECQIASCAVGKQAVEIPFSALNPWLNPRTLGNISQ